MFINNKYNKLYYFIIENAANVRIKFKTQNHHIIPESIGGSNDPDNRVHLTHKEHFVCHHLLTKMTTGEEWKSMVYAMHCMQADGRHQTRYSEGTVRAFAENKKNYSKIASERMTGENNPQFGRVWTDEEREEQSNKIKGRIQPQHEKEKQIAAITGRTRDPFSNKHKANLSKNHASKQPGYDGSHSEETKRKLCIAAQNRAPQTREVIEAAAKKRVGSKRKKKLCPHCNQHIAVNTYPRWHGDNCKQK